MNRFLLLVLALLLFGAKAPYASAQDAGSAWSAPWGFQPSDDRAVDFAIALTQKRLHDGTDGSRVVVNNTTSATTNIQGGVSNVTLDGDGNLVEVSQASDGQQTATANSGDR